MTNNIFTTDRLATMIRSQKIRLEVVENNLLEASVNYKFDPTDSKLSTLQYQAGRLAEIRNYIETLEAMAENRVRAADQTPEAIQQEFSKMLLLSA